MSWSVNKFSSSFIYATRFAFSLFTRTFLLANFIFIIVSFVDNEFVFTHHFLNHLLVLNTPKRKENY